MNNKDELRKFVYTAGIATYAGGGKEEETPKDRDLKSWYILKEIGITVTVTPVLRAPVGWKW